MFYAIWLIGTVFCYLNVKVVYRLAIALTWPISLPLLTVSTLAFGMETNWQYSVVQLNTLETIEILGQIKSMGQQGWELVARLPGKRLLLKKRFIMPPILFIPWHAMIVDSYDKCVEWKKKVKEKFARICGKETTFLPELTDSAK